MIRLKIVLFALSNNHSLTITLTRQGLFMKFNYMEINIMFCSLDGKNIIYHLHHELAWCVIYNNKYKYIARSTKQIESSGINKIENKKPPQCRNNSIIQQKNRRNKMVCLTLFYVIIYNCVILKRFRNMIILYSRPDMSTRKPSVSLWNSQQVDYCVLKTKWESL